jgi:transcriptional regulator with XRE-family HTH domain
MYNENQVKITDEQKWFIIEHRDILPQSEIAKQVKVSPTWLSYFLRGKRGNISELTGIFDVDEFGKHYEY